MITGDKYDIGEYNIEEPWTMTDTCFSSDNQFVLVTSDTVVNLYTTTGEYITNFKGDGVSSACFSHNGRYIALANSRHVVMLEIETEEVVYEFEVLYGRGTYLTFCHFSPNDRFIVAGCEYGYPVSASIWNVESKLAIKSFNFHHISKNGRMIYGVQRDAIKVIYVDYIPQNDPDPLCFWDVTRALQLQWYGPRAPYLEPEPIGQGNAVILALRDHFIMWDHISANYIKTRKEHVIYAFAVAPDGKSIVSVSEDGNTVIWVRKRNLYNAIGYPLELAQIICDRI
jgi:WD40 repeat protein